MNPNRIVVAGRDQAGFDFHANEIPVFRIPETSMAAPIFKPETGDMVVWLESPSAEVNLPGSDLENIWFLHRLGDARMYDFFEKLKSDDNVTQTFELNSCGIVIFNPKFQKEDFVIKGKKSY